MRAPTVLIVSASDPTSGAGMQADVQTVSSLGCHPLSILSGITVQDTIGVEQVSSVAPALFAAQLKAIFTDSKVDVIKCGMLSSKENMEVFANLLQEHPTIPVIFDPVMASGRGDALSTEAMRQYLLEHIMPHVTLITPNSIEAKQLVKIDDQKLKITMKEAAKRLQASGCHNVLITGSHEQTDEVINQLFLEDGSLQSYAWKRLPHAYHGSGCTLASAIAAYLAQGLNLRSAVEEGQDFTWHALQAALQIGHGQRIPNRFFWMNEFDEDEDDPTHH